MTVAREHRAMLILGTAALLLCVGLGSKPFSHELSMALQHGREVDQARPNAEQLTDLHGVTSKAFMSLDTLTEVRYSIPRDLNLCHNVPSRLHLSDPPYENYFYSDCHGASQVVVTSPLPGSNLTIIGPRLLVAWPAGNAGLVAYFSPQSGINGSLALQLVNATDDTTLVGFWKPATEASQSSNPRVGVSTIVHFNSSARLTVPIIGSIRNIRDFTEGPSILRTTIQDAVEYRDADGSISLSRRWLDNQTYTSMSFTPHGKNASMNLSDKIVTFSPGQYNFTAWLDYPQLNQLSPDEVLNAGAKGLISQNPDQTKSLSFLSYSEKLIAGAWRFLTYFGRDSMISLLLLQPILSEGTGGAIEAVIAAVLERVNASDGSVCHEETIGDYATFLNLQKGMASTKPGCTYLMVDTDFLLAPVMEAYFVKTAVGRERVHDFLATISRSDFGNVGQTYAKLAQINAEKVMNASAAFAQDNGQTVANLIHLKPDELVGQWRDSTYGIGGGRIPFDVNTALVPAALRSIAALSSAGLFPTHPEWVDRAAYYATIWEDHTLQFFEVTVPHDQAKSLVAHYTKRAGKGFASRTDTIAGDIRYHGLALQGNNNQSVVKVMNTDDCFRHFLVNGSNQEQLTAFINQSATNIRSPFPVGLSNPVGLLVANPAYGEDPVYAANWTNNVYHGTVVWSWQMSMMAAGLERQLARCSLEFAPEFCVTPSVYDNVIGAYNHLWDLIEANSPYLSKEVWSWQWNENDFSFEPLGALPPPAGMSPVESNIRQLWSLTFLAVTRNKSLRLGSSASTTPFTSEGSHSGYLTTFGAFDLPFSGGTYAMTALIISIGVIYIQG